MAILPRIHSDKLIVAKCLWQLPAVDALAVIQHLCTLSIVFVEVVFCLPRNQIEAIMVSTHIVPGCAVGALFNCRFVHLPFLRILCWYSSRFIFGVNQISSDNDELRANAWLLVAAHHWQEDTYFITGRADCKKCKKWMVCPCGWNCEICKSETWIK